MQRIILALALVLALAAHAFAAEILVYTALEDDQIPRYIKSFKEKHPDIDVKFVRDSTGIVTAKLLAEKDNPQADVVWGLSAVSLMQFKAAGLLEPYTPADGGKVLPSFKDAGTPPVWYGIDAWMTGFCVNTVELENKKLPMPTSFADLVKPEYKGQVTMPNPASSGTGFLTVSAILQLMGEEQGWAYLDQLNDNISSYTHSGSKPCKLAGTGESTIGISFGYRGIQQKKKGEPIETVFPKEGSGWDLEANALVKKAAIKPEAKTFLDWAVSPEAIQEYAQSFAVTGYPTGTPIPEGYPAEPTKQMIKNDFDWAAKNRDAILAEWTKRYDGKSEPKK
ncbi:putative 2-aminoethylphosphonate ABC transporter substrate-binding protein [Desulfovibrio sp. TomC]|uniref:putative 2-aminoethylphosphonate ABC transporter substrate-binding protein n=1 Tax=Desulfovibrio sp. TomC TaxID=1562888 RepID=UPI0005730E6F|nr:putative 2-aminoethylphosphonate ABC transporter substrate-binding protein [Desulfovibrio sp. TomC]KHK00631.1 Ferric iron ABC transporter, iron-binding protein [Desulfovibrio sp. TomC]